MPNLLSTLLLHYIPSPHDDLFNWLPIINSSFTSYVFLTFLFSSPYKSSWKTIPTFKVPYICKTITCFNRGRVCSDFLLPTTHKLVFGVYLTNSPHPNFWAYLSSTLSHTTVVLPLAFPTCLGCPLNPYQSIPLFCPLRPCFVSPLSGSCL